MTGDPRYPGAGPGDCGLQQALAWAGRSPFFGAKLKAAGVDPDRPSGWDEWRAIRPTTKAELRSLESFDDEVVIAPRAEIVEFWRSGGVTGAPLYYPRTRADLDHALESFARGLRIAGVTAGDTVMCSLPLGIHPAGQLNARAAERIGAAVIWAGAGSQLPSAAQIELIGDLKATVWIGMASFGLHLGHVAEAAGESLADAGIRLLVTTAEPLSPSKRDLLSRLWGGPPVRDLFGMTEVSMLAAECGCLPGLHLWTETSFCEVLDPETHDPVEPGEVGVLCVTGKATGSATPFVRWVSDDLVHLEFGCDCPHHAYPRLVHSGRTSGFFKIRGVNISHGECEELLYAVPTLRDFRVSATAEDGLLAEVESSAGADEATRAAVERLFSLTFGLRAEVVALERGTIAAGGQGTIKARRFFDLR